MSHCLLDGNARDKNKTLFNEQMTLTLKTKLRVLFRLSVNEIMYRSYHEKSAFVWQANLVFCNFGNARDIAVSKNETHVQRHVRITRCLQRSTSNIRIIS